MVTSTKRTLAMDISVTSLDVFKSYQYNHSTNAVLYNVIKINSFVPREFYFFLTQNSPHLFIDFISIQIFELNKKNLKKNKNIQIKRFERVQKL